jgi:ubiquinone/menaquinone biosynthesis C-methylase UbiE
MVLELAQGPGHLLVAMARQGLTPVGLDLSPQMGRLARRRLVRLSLPLRLVRARAQALPFRDGTFPDVVATFPTEFILAPRTLREVKRVLSPGGEIVVVAGAQLTGRDPLSRFLEWLYRITGQRAPLPRGDEPLWEESGLTLRAEWISAARSRVLLVVGGPAPGDW